MVKPELNASVELTPEKKNFNFSSLVPLHVHCCSQMPHSFTFLHWSYQGGKLYYTCFQLLAQSLSPQLEQKCCGGQNRPSSASAIFHQ